MSVSIQWDIERELTPGAKNLRGPHLEFTNINKSCQIFTKY